jgi:hypothetical protein
LKRAQFGVGGAMRLFEPPGHCGQPGAASQCGEFKSEIADVFRYLKGSERVSFGHDGNAPSGCGSL